jgi:hypothetical protein
MIGNNRFVFLLTSVFGCWTAFNPGVQAAPLVTNLSLYGLQTGATTTLAIEGADLLPAPRLLLSVPITDQSVRRGATATRVEVEVTLPTTVPAGLYHLRVANAKGVSNALLIGIDDLVQIPFGPQVNRLPAALNGRLPGSAILTTSFSGKRGQRVVVDLEARRLGAAIDPVLELYDPRHAEVALAQGTTLLHGDARFQAVLPFDGTYTIEFHDALYRAGAPDYFRLKIGELYCADLVYPLSGQRGSEGWFELLGPGFSPGLRLQAQLQNAKGDLPAPLPPLRGLTGPAPRIQVGEFPEILQSDLSAGKLQEVTVPAIINGRIRTSHEEDRYRLRVQPGMRLRFDVLANRAGSPLDGILSIRNEAGAELAGGDDRPELNTTDPGVDFTVPAGVQALVVALRDLEGRSGPNFVYRLAITPLDHPDFDLTLFEDRQAIPLGGAAVVRVQANRAGYQGPIKLTLRDLPAGLAVANVEIPTGANDALVTIAAPTDASPGAFLTSIIGSSTDPNNPFYRTALLPADELTQRQPWLRSELALALLDAAPIQLAWTGSDSHFAIGSTYPAHFHVIRTTGAAGAVRLTLLTSQVVPRTQDGKQEDRNRAIRFQGSPVIAAGQSEGLAPILLPGDLSLLPYDLAVRAELLAPDNRTVLATVLSPSRRLQASQPFALQLTSAPTVQAASGSGPTGKLTGKIVRAPGFSKPVTVTLAGLPAELPAPMIMLPADKSEFELPISFPYETKLGLLANVRLVATSQVSPQRLLTSNEVPLAVQVVQGNPPPAEAALYRVFEDEPNFPALLHEGDAQITLETGDRYAGAAAVQVTGIQRGRRHMPGWRYKIAEKPGPGEYRYVRFAWQKRRGNNLLLQLGANGHWGPERGKAGPSYRYEAGAGDNALHAAAVRVAPQLPDDWEVVTRDLFADFGPFVLSGIGFVSGTGEPAFFDHIYLARSLEAFKDCVPPIRPSRPYAIFEDNARFPSLLQEGAGTAQLEEKDKYSGTASVKVTPDQRFNERMPGWELRIRQNPRPGEYRFLRFAWKKHGGETICLQLNHDGSWGPTPGAPGKFRYHAGPGPEVYGASLAVDNKIPGDWVVVTRDLYADFGEFTLTGIALSPVDGEYALFDHLYLGRTSRDFELVKPKTAPTK